MHRQRFGKDHLAGALLMLLGVAVVLAAWRYRMGNLTRMGAGYVPVVLGLLLAVVGALIALTARGAATSVQRAGPHAAPAFEWRAWSCILGAIGAFVVLGTYGGMVPATFACTFIAALGDRTNRPRDALYLATAMVVAGWLIFIVGLRVQMPAFAWGA
jgi:hypothetical protein